MLARLAERLQMHQRRPSTGECMILKMATFRMAVMAFPRSSKQAITGLLILGLGKCNL